MDVRTLSLTRDGHTYVFRYTPGCEDEVVDEIMLLADRPDAHIDWLDAATLSFQITQYAAADCQAALKAPQEHQD